MFVYRLDFSRIQLFNILMQLIFDVFLVRSFGVNALVYLILSSFLAGSLHPCAGHFIAEHYVLDQPSKFSSSTHQSASGARKVEKDPAEMAIPETFSYYGTLNLLTYNVGLHNEHHDFPAVPWTRLPTLHDMAKEFYADLPCHNSWVAVVWQFIWDPSVGLNCRVKRRSKTTTTASTTTCL